MKFERIGKEHELVLNELNSKFKDAILVSADLRMKLEQTSEKLEKESALCNMKIKELDKALDTLNKTEGELRKINE